MINGCENTIKGCVLGLAIGDAMGYPIEFTKYNKIKYTFGEVDDFEGTTTNNYQIGRYSDDTQMSISTIEAILKTSNLKNHTEIGTNLIAEYIRWFQSQSNENSNRHPGATCISALKHVLNNKLTIVDCVKTKLNDSKGCGGIMRVAPLGLVTDSVGDAFALGELSSLITHSHDLSRYSSGYMAGLIYLLKEGNPLIKSIEICNSYISDIPELLEIVNKAVKLSQNQKLDYNNIKEIGEGWVAEETLAIAIYSSLRYENNFKAGIVASINHDGDSDSTGCLTGAILGVINGIDNIPKDLVERVENSSFLLNLCNKLNLYIQKTDY